MFVYDDDTYIHINELFKTNFDKNDIKKYVLTDYNFSDIHMIIKFINDDIYKNYGCIIIFIQQDYLGELKKILKNLYKFSNLTHIVLFFDCPENNLYNGINKLFEIYNILDTYTVVAKNVRIFIDDWNDLPLELIYCNDKNSLSKNRLLSNFT